MYKRNAHWKKNSTNPHITDTIVVSDFRNVNVAGSDLIGLMNQKKKSYNNFPDTVFSTLNIQPNEEKLGNLYKSRKHWILDVHVMPADV